MMRMQECVSLEKDRDGCPKIVNLGRCAASATEPPAQPAPSKSTSHLKPPLNFFSLQRADRLVLRKEKIWVQKAVRAGSTRIPAVKISLHVLRIPQLGAIFHLGKCWLTSTPACSDTPSAIALQSILPLSAVVTGRSQLLFWW